jgi:hypothetical protein
MSNGAVVGYTTRPTSRQVSTVPDIIQLIEEQKKEMEYLQGKQVMFQEQLSNIFRAFRSINLEQGHHQADIELFTSREVDNYGRFLDDRTHKVVYDKLFCYPVIRDGITSYEYAFESVPQENGGEERKPPDLNQLSCCPSVIRCLRSKFLH